MVFHELNTDENRKQKMNLKSETIIIKVRRYEVGLQEAFTTSDSLLACM